MTRLFVAGNIPAVVTPFDERGDVMLDKLQALVRWHLDRGADAICLAGDNGEAWTLGPDERRRIAEAAIKVVAGRVPVLIGASTTTARQSIQYAEAAAAAGVDALMVGPQSYVGKTTTSELVTRFTAIHKAVPLPIVVYNSPRRTGLNLDAASLAAICDAVDVIAVKESSRDFFHVTEILRDFADRIAVLVGPAPLILWGVGLGARGFISSGPELFGGLAARLCEIGRRAPDAETRDVHIRLTTIYQALMGVGTWPAALKHALTLVGAPAGLPREPVQPLGPDDRAKLEKAMRAVGLLDAAAAKVA